MVLNIRSFFVLILVLVSITIQSQTLSGNIKNVENINISNAIVTIGDSITPAKEFTIARNGSFSLKLKKEYKKIIIEVKSIGFKNEYFKIVNPIKEKLYTINFTLLEDKTIELNEITIVSAKKPYIIKKDTLSFSVDGYKKIGDRKVQDVLRRMPGIVINEKSGQIKYNGKPVENVTLDGDDLFGYNYSLGTKNINLDMIEQVQAISNYSVNPLLKGIESGDKVSLNLKLKKDKVDYSGNIDFGLGINNNSKILNNTNANMLRITNKYKSFAILSYNNIGVNNSPFDYFSNDESVEKIKEKNLTTQKVLSEYLFSNIIDDDRSNLNNLLFSNYNNIFKISRRITFKTNLYYLNDNINFVQNTLNELIFNNTTLTTTDNFNTNKKPQLYRGDIQVKFNTSKNTLLETTTKFSYESIETKSDIITNSVKSFESNLSTKNSFFNQNLIFTKKLSSKKAFQIYANYSYNNIPQKLLLLQTSLANSQSSNFKKEFFDTYFNFLGNTNKLKYSTTFGSSYQQTAYLSNTNQSNLEIDNNSIEYDNSNFYNRSSLNYQIDNWTFTPSYSLKILNQKLKNNISKNNFLFEPSFFLKYKIDNKSSLSAKINYTQNTFDEKYIYQNPILTSNRVKESNTPSLEIQKSLIYNLNYFNNNLYNQFLLSFDLNYQKNNAAYFSEYIINGDETIINNFFSDKKSSNLNIDLTTEKFIPLFSTRFKFKSNYNRNNYINIINTAEIRDNINQLFVNEFSIKTAFNTKINFENDLFYSYSKTTSSDNTSIKNNSITNYSKLKFKISQSIYAIFALDYFVPNTTNKNNEYLFLDFNFSYKPIGKKYEFNLSGKNLLNNKVFSQIQTNDFSKSTYQSNLISRYIFVNLTYNL